MKKGSKFNLELPIFILQDKRRQLGPGDVESRQSLDEAVVILKGANKARERAIKKYWEEASKLPKYGPLDRKLKQMKKSS